MKSIVLVLLILLSGCAGCPPAPTPVDAGTRPMIVSDMMVANVYGIPSCPLTTTVTFADVCEGLFTLKGLACAHCTDGAQCFDAVDGVYCASGPKGCLGDDMCHPFRDGTRTEKPELKGRR
jgi:hypothetical protein